VEVAGLPSTEELKDKALYYILHHLGGDALRHDQPPGQDPRQRPAVNCPGVWYNGSGSRCSSIGEV
jgi:hypothetical protein